MVQIKWCWFHSKIFIFGQVMSKNGVYVHIWHMIFGNNSTIFGPIALEFVMGAQKTVID